MALLGVTSHMIEGGPEKLFLRRPTSYIFFFILIILPIAAGAASGFYFGKVVGDYSGDYAASVCSQIGGLFTGSLCGLLLLVSIGCWLEGPLPPESEWAQSMNLEIAQWRAEQRLHARRSRASRTIFGILHSCKWAFGSIIAGIGGGGLAGVIVASSSRLGTEAAMGIFRLHSQFWDFQDPAASFWGCLGSLVGCGIGGTASIFICILLLVIGLRG